MGMDDFDISPTELALFRRLLRLLICTTLLVCPATGGQCCGDVDVFQDAPASVSGCGDCCCEHQTAPSGSDTPISPPCPNQCHDCICAGALPPAFETPMPQTNIDGLVAYVVPSMDESVQSPVDSSLCHGNNGPDGFKPRSGRALLTAYCTLLL